MDLIEDRKRVLVYFQEKGIMVTKTALDLILDSSMGELLPKMVTQEVLDAGYLTENDVLKLIRKPERRKMDFEVYIPDIKAHSSVEDFQEMFTDRYERLKKIIVQSAEMRGTYTIKSAKKTQGKVKIVGMVSG